MSVSSLDRDDVSKKGSGLSPCPVSILCDVDGKSLDFSMCAVAINPEDDLELLFSTY